MLERVVLVHGDRGHAVDGIRDYTNRLADALASHAQRVEVRAQAPAGPLRGTWRGLAEARELRGMGPGSAVVLQYSPFCFARWGFAPWLPLWGAALGSGRRRPTLAVMVHEPYVPMTGWRWRLMGLWQRFQLSALRVGADMLFTSIAPWATMLSAHRPRRPVHHLPVGSNLPDRRGEREPTRDRLGIGEKELAVAALGRDHPSWLREYVVGAANSIAAAGHPVVLLCLGAEAPRLDGLDDGVRLHAPGFLAADELAAHLAAADLFLVPLIDGVSTRRGALMAALQHGLPVVGTSGRLTDPVLRRSTGALRLTEVGDPHAFARAAAGLAASTEDRASAAAQARRMYERSFDWPVIAERMLAALGER
jgi:glycosyltransferase involved in cell wall biosynthesis